MNALEQHIAANRLNEIEVLNQLTEAGLISDNAIMAVDVWEGDAVRAVRWLTCEDILWI